MVLAKLHGFWFESIGMRNFMARMFSNIIIPVTTGGWGKNGDFVLISS